MEFALYREFLLTAGSCSLEQTTKNQHRNTAVTGFARRPLRMIEEDVSGSVAASERPGLIGPDGKWYPATKLLTISLTSAAISFTSSAVAIR
jgi:hypothetical protein